MLTVSLHGIKVQAPRGLYAEEHIIGNAFEVDVDIWLPDAQPWPYADYTLVQKTVAAAFLQKERLLEAFVFSIYTDLKANFPFAEKIRVAVRKLHPPMHGSVSYAQVCYETPLGVQ